MLQEGFHQAFCQLFNLLEKENKLFNQGDNEVIVQRIEDQPEKLDTLKENLIIAEIANRRGNIFFHCKALMLPFTSCIKQ